MALTPLGMWLVHRILATVADVPVAGSLADVTADELLTQAADLPTTSPGSSSRSGCRRTVTRRWRFWSRRSRRRTRRGVSSPSGLLLDVGPPAAEAMARLVDDPELGAYALIWRVKTGLAEEEELDAGGDPERLIRTLSAVAGPVGSRGDAVLARHGGGCVRCQCAAVEETWRVRLPETDAVLATLGSFHPRRTWPRRPAGRSSSSAPAADRRTDLVRRLSEVRRGVACAGPEASRSLSPAERSYFGFTALYLDTMSLPIRLYPEFLEWMSPF